MLSETDVFVLGALQWRSQSQLLPPQQLKLTGPAPTSVEHILRKRCIRDETRPGVLLYNVFADRLRNGCCVKVLGASHEAC